MVGAPRYCAEERLPWGEAPIGTHELLVERQRSAERLILGLRLSDGIPTAWLDARIAVGPARLSSLVDAWRTEGLVRSPYDTLTLSVPRALLAPGSYRFILYGRRDGALQHLEEYLLVVSHR